MPTQWYVSIRVNHDHQSVVWGDRVVPTRRIRNDKRLTRTLNLTPFLLQKSNATRRVFPQSNIGQFQALDWMVKIFEKPDYLATAKRGSKNGKQYTCTPRWDHAFSSTIPTESGAQKELSLVQVPAGIVKNPRFEFALPPSATSRVQVHGQPCYKNSVFSGFELTSALRPNLHSKVNLLLAIIINYCALFC
jgi:hypothetical protein